LSFIICTPPGHTTGKRSGGGEKIRILQAASEALAEASPLTLVLVGLGAVVALPALQRGLRSAAEVTSRGISETSDVISGLTENVKSGWGAMIQEARASYSNAEPGHVGTVTGAALGGVVGASAGGPLGAGLGAVVGGGLGSAVGRRRAHAAFPPPESRQEGAEAQ